CGMVLVENTEVAIQPRTFTKEEFESKNQTGAPTSLARHDMGLSTMISRFNKDASGRKLDGNMRAVMDRLRTWDMRTQYGTSTDRNLMFALNELNKLKHKLALSDPIIEKSAYIYRKAQGRKLVRGRTKIALVAASVYAACREFATQRTLKEISSVSDVKRRDLARCYRLLIKELKLRPPLQDPAKLVTKIANALSLDEKISRDAVRILEVIKESGGAAGKDPTGMSGAILYLSSLKNNIYPSQKEIAKATGVTEVTIRNRVKEARTKYKHLL
ncbi:MAG: transcription initiation factor IIB, partial [Nitrososphaerales archaeon]